MNTINVETNKETNFVLDRLLSGIKQNKYNLKKQGLYIGLLKKKMEELLSILKDYYK